MIDSLFGAQRPASGAVSEETAFVLEADDVRLLTEVGFLAAASGDLARTRAIFTALQLARPGRAFPRIGLAVGLMNAGRASEAAHLLGESVGENAEEQTLLDAWRGLALQLAGHGAESRRVLEDAAQTGDTEGARLARGLLGQDDRMTVRDDDSELNGRN